MNARLWIFSVTIVVSSLLNGRVSAQDATSKQIPAGTSATMTPARITPTADSGRQKKMLDAALTPQTRQTLQEAMNSVGESNSK